MIRDENGKWLDSSILRSEAIKFQTDGFYCDYPKKTQGYKEYWDEQLRRCREGYKVGDVKITGHHYFYLNFSRIELTKKRKNGKGNRKVLDFPDFWDYDYEYFWWLEIARFGVLGDFSQCRELLTKKEIKDVDSGKLSDEQLDALKEDVLYNRLKLRLRAHKDYLDGGHHMIVAKARRKGFTYKNTAVMTNIYNTERNSQCVFGVAQSTLGDQGMKFVNSYLSFLNMHTAWGKRREFHNTQDHKRASYAKKKDGLVSESGYMSEIILSSFMNNSEATRGKSPYLMLYEEAGTFTNLLDVWGAAIPSMEDGDEVTGFSILFGTGGKISSDKGEFSQMFYNPEFYNLMPFVNVWDEGMSHTYCGFFFPAHWDLVGYIDEQGNSDIDGSLEYILNKRRKKLETATTADEYQKEIIEYPICPQESFITFGRMIFNIPKLDSQLRRVRAENLNLKKGVCVKLGYVENGTKVSAKPILDGSANPVLEYNTENKTDLTGCPIIYEYPIENPPRGLYKIGYDPYRQDDSTTTSLAAIIVYKGVYKGDFSRNMIVAEYVGRPATCDECDEIALKFAILYNTEVMFENNVTHTAKYFERRHKLDRLALQPDNAIRQNIKNSAVKRVFGCNLDKRMKDAGEKYLKEWLLEVIDYDENGDEITVVDRIYSIGLLEELIKYNKKGNFDRVCALFQIMFQLQDEELEHVYGQEKTLKTMSMELERLQLFKKNNTFARNLNF